MVITLKFPGGDAPQWWTSIRGYVNLLKVQKDTDFNAAMKTQSGFDVEFDCGYYTDGGISYYRAITGEETEITAMLLKWS